MVKLGHVVYGAWQSGADEGAEVAVTAGRDAGEVGRDGGVDRRAMLKAAAAVGVAGATWTAPRIETLGFAPAAAAGTPCTILSPERQDFNSNSTVPANVYCATVGTFPCCTGEEPPESGVTNFGNQGQGQFDEWVFDDPHPGCESVTVRMVPLDCAANTDPSLARMAAVISDTEGTCNCTVLEGVLIQSSGRVQRRTMNNGPSTCLEDGVDISLSCTDPILLDIGNDARLAVRISCITGVPGCVST